MAAQTIEEYKAYLRGAHGWFYAIHWEDGKSRPYYVHPEAKCTEVPFPHEAGQFGHLAVTLPMLCEMDRVEWGGGTLIFTDWGIWSESANVAGYQMVERIRSSFGELRPFEVATVNLFRRDEHPLLTSFILAALIYGWDAYYVPNYGGCFVHISHDEYCLIVTKTTEDFEKIVGPHLERAGSGYRVIENGYYCRPSK
jgi:hypothetical protein